MDVCLFIMTQLRIIFTKISIKSYFRNIDLKYVESIDKMLNMPAEFNEMLGKERKSKQNNSSVTLFLKFL